MALLMAIYLTLIRERKVVILDMDYQQSLFSKAEKSAILDNKPLFEVVSAELSMFSSLETMLKRKDEIVLIDLPGKMDDDGLLQLFQKADLVICPFGFDELSVDSTVLFAMVVKKIHEINGMGSRKQQLVFIPNRIKSQVKYETKVEVEKVLSRFGDMTPYISERIDFQRLTAFEIPIKIAPVVIPVFDHIYEKYLSR